MTGIAKSFDSLVAICNQVLLSEDKPTRSFLLSHSSAEEWDNLFSLAAKHGMLPTVISFLETKKIEDDSLRKVIIKWYAVAQNFKKEYQKRVLTMRELSMMFAEDGLDIMFFKGAVLAQLYPYPEWRVFSDIDFYLYGKCVEGNKVLARHGIESRPYYHHNTEATLHGILLENHYDFVERLNHRQNLVLDDELKKLADEEGKSISATFLGDDIRNAYVMTPTMNAIFLMRHMSAHFVSESIPLRMLYDWALFLKHHSKEVDWKRVERLYKASGMIEFVGIIQGLLQKFFSVSFPECPVKPLMGEKMERVWHSIMCPPVSNPYKKQNIAYFLYETKVFIKNRWKHQIVYPSESYLLLFIRYTWSVLKKKQKQRDISLASA